MMMKAASGLPVFAFAFLVTSFAGLVAKPPAVLASPELSPSISGAWEPPAKQASPPTPIANPDMASASQESVHARARVPGLPARLPILGLGIDVGVPDGANLSVVARPCRWSRVQFAVGNNGISYGWRLGATFLPFRDGPAAVIECVFRPDPGADSGGTWAGIPE
jgi:hypothetical protein